MAERASNCCRQWLALRQRWQEIGSRGFTAAHAGVRRLSGVRAAQHIAHWPALLDCAPDAPVPEAPGEDALEDIASLSVALHGVVDALAQVLLRMKALHRSLQMLVEQTLLVNGEEGLQQPLGDGLVTLDDLVMASHQLISCYSRELVLRRELASAFFAADSRDAHLLYLTAWVDQPFLAPDAPKLFDILRHGNGA